MTQCGFNQRFFTKPFLKVEVKVNELMENKLVTKNIAFFVFFLVLYVNLENEKYKEKTIKFLNILMSEKKNFISPMLGSLRNPIAKVIVKMMKKMLMSKDEC